MQNKNIITPKGMGVAASTFDGNRKKLPTTNNKIAIVSQAQFWKKLFRCGHVGPWWFILNVYGAQTPRIKRWKFCPDCLIQDMKKYVIKCGLCRLPIYPGEGVSLYHIGSEGLCLDDSTIINDDSVIGCLRMQCCPSAGFYSGHWTKEGFKPLYNGKTVAEHICS